MGTSIYDYIIQVRIEKMTQLLCEGMSVSEAAVELGFSDLKNVSRSFKQIKGITPSEYPAAGHTGQILTHGEAAQNEDPDAHIGKRADGIPAIFAETNNSIA
ncbi:MAG: helix-turn-helix transcriptional regulator [Alistipes senegalensis]